jgi:thioredoxin-dependent peroxiredoxin
VITTFRAAGKLTGGSVCCFHCGDGAGLKRYWFKIESGIHIAYCNRIEASMLRIILLAIVLIVAVLLVPRLLSRSATPAEGSDAPDFTLPSQEGTVSLRDYRGKWVVLYFYPKDQTPGCTREAHNFQIDQSKYLEHNAVVLGVSVDSVASHKKFCTKEGLNFKLLADTRHNVSDAYGSLTNLGIVKFSARHTFLIDPSGKIARVYTNVDPLKHSGEVLAELDALQKSVVARP